MIDRYKKMTTGRIGPPVWNNVKDILTTFRAKVRYEHDVIN